MKVWKLADPRITNENALVIRKEASWWLVGYSEVGTTFIPNSVCANCVPDSEATQSRRTANLTHGR
jgi:hypothetical protein